MAQSLAEYVVMAEAAKVLGVAPCIGIRPMAKILEQQRIADCLSTLDARIVAEADKLAALKTHKKGLMQQLFPSPESG